MTGGLRDRKKQETRRRVSDTAIGLFVERGFDHVTIAEVAEAAGVSANTVYNYFETKENLVLPPDEASPDRLAAMVRDREPGEAAVCAVLRVLRAEVARRDRSLGLTEGFGRVFEMMRAAPTLSARLEELGRQMRARLAAVLAEETGASPGDPLPRVVAWQIGALHELVYTEIGARTAAGHDPDAIAAAVLAVLDAAEHALGGPILTYATKEAAQCSE
ncbi:TetR family transcriptional regulator [Herbidospora galbida]|uniref:TetR family transcriptional regulator n=1 Tax=Herbidospora galbida TaxID=2575442 RepID=A0A4U3MLS7_9ACTN|nr:TetR/AcrR family transcriptional regulator [Herbidospora galbida]TKK89514.1 TetR family transcriptional regulator [Herbidospora galbida]